MHQQLNNILIVEDRADWQDILCSTLTRQGHTPYPAGTYQDALAALESRNYNLAVVDPVLDMTNRFNRDGLSIIQKIHETRPNLPIIVLTGSFTHDMEVTLKQLYPALPILFKESWDAKAFSEVVDKLMGRQQPTPAPTTYGLVASPTGINRLTPPPPEKAAGRPRVLLVENRPDWQDIVAATLNEADFFWRVAENAQQALDEMEREGFHLVILDFN